MPAARDRGKEPPSISQDFDSAERLVQQQV